MSLQRIHLRKLLKILYLEPRQRTSAIRSDIRDEIVREHGGDVGGGDFYSPFWRNAKDHVFNVTDLREQTRIRIEDNPRRRNLYPVLRDGFLLWWDQRRRWTNQPFVRAADLKTVCRLPGIDADIKFAHILSVRDGQNEDHFVYPYWFPVPALTDESARLALWALSNAFPDINPTELRVLDVMRGQTFSLSPDRNPLQGNEAETFQHRFRVALAEWHRLRREYD